MRLIYLDCHFLVCDRELDPCDLLILAPSMFVSTKGVWCCQPEADGGWDERPECCIICGLPSLSSLNESTPRESSGEPVVVSVSVGTEWLDDWVGVTPEQPKQPIPIGTLTGPGEFELDASEIASDEPTHPFCTFRQAYPYVKHCMHKYHYMEEFRPRQHQGPEENSEQEQLQEDTQQEYESPWEVVKVEFPDVEPGMQGYQSGLHFSDFARKWVRYGVAYHRACGQVLQQRLGYTLNFNHTWPLLREQLSHNAPMVNYLYANGYGGVGKHYDREFDCFYLPFGPSSEYMMLDPRLCSSNADRLVAVWEPMVQKFREQDTAAAAAAAAGSAARADLAEQRVEPPAAAAPPASAATAAKPAGQLSPQALAAAGAAASALAGRLHLAAAPVVQAPEGSEVEPGLQSQLQQQSALLLQVVVRGCSPQLQPLVAAHLLPLCSNMTQVLQDQLQLAVTLRTAAQAVSFGAWLSKRAGLVVGLQLDLAVDCCPKDIDTALQAVLQGVSTAAQANKAMKLTSLHAHLHDTAGATSLLTALPLAHLTSLTLTGECGVSTAAAVALAAATALQSFTVPGKGLAASLAAAAAAESAATASSGSHGSGSSSNPAMFRVAATSPGLAAPSTSSAQSPSPAAGLSVPSLQRLCLTDGDGCSAEDLRLLGQQLQGLREVRLGYQPQIFDWRTYNADEDEGGTTGGGWSALPVVSLEFGVKRFPGEGKLHEGFDTQYALPTIANAVVDSLAKLTGLTRLAFGPTACFADDLHMPDGPVPLLALMLQPLTSLQELELTMDAASSRDTVGAHQLFQLLPVREQGGTWSAWPLLFKGRAAVLRAVAQLPCLRKLKLGAGVCFGASWDAGDCLDELAAATKLVELEITGTVQERFKPSINTLQTKLQGQGLKVVCSCGSVLHR